MFKVKDKMTGNIYVVYDVHHIARDRSDTICFLIFTEYSTWVYINANDFEPVD